MIDPLRIILKFKQGGGFLHLDHRYFPPEVVRVQDPLEADRFHDREEALQGIDNVHKQSRDDFSTRRLVVQVRQ